METRQKKMHMLDVCTRLYYVKENTVAYRRGYHLDDNSGFYPDYKTKDYVIIDKNTGLEVMRLNSSYNRSIENVKEFYPVIKELIKRRRLFDKDNYRKDVTNFENLYLEKHGKMLWYIDVES